MMSNIIKGIIIQNIQAFGLYSNAFGKFNISKLLIALVIPHKGQPIHWKLIKYAKYM